ncbi:MAG TPA: hypothetical protein VFL12_11655 [Thermoanaerobaculia bacterium]|nr:hypothetical protein [Thermoanaerobaculia bacterium]
MAKTNVFSIIEDLKSGLDDLVEALEPLARVAARETRRGVRRGRRATRRIVRRNLPKATRQLRVLQARYMTLVRRLSKVQKEQVRKLRKTKGYKEALRLAARLSR